MTPDALQATALAVAQERDLGAVLRRVVQGLAAQRGVALARIWLVDRGGPCEACPLAGECDERARCLHLAASAGAPRAADDAGAAEDWTRTDGRFRRIPLGVRKVGRVAATGRPLLLDLGRETSSAADPAWVRRERIRSFAGQPLVFRGEVLGALAVFSRVALGRDELGWLRTFADQAATAIAHGRAWDEVERLRRRLELENAYLREEVAAERAPGELLGEGPAIEKVREQVRLVAPTRATVLVTGESGTGKELVARAIHAGSPRAPDGRERPLIVVNCASVPRDLFESEFFGHVQGAFTGAVRDRVGRFELADKGTLFLDEVGEIPLELQGKLLRALQDGRFQRVGDEVTRAIDARVVAATNRDLEAEVAAGRFRRDLYYRLGVFPIEVPPLRERREDIPLLADAFARRSARRLGLPAPALTEADLRALDAHDWPGNVRELENVLERAIILARGGPLRLEVGAGAPRRRSARDERAPAGAILTDAELRRRERENTLAALRACGGRVHGPAGAARLLGLRPTTLLSRLKAMGLDRTRDGPRDR